MLHSYSRRQSFISISLAESEFYALSAVALEGCLFARVLEFCGFIVKTYVLTDSSSDKATSQREGVGKVSHLDTRSLWLQGEVKAGRLTMLKVGTDDNLADIGTEGHDKVKLEKFAFLNNLVDMDVEIYPETIAASASLGSASLHLRAALFALATATAAYLLVGEAAGQSDAHMIASGISEALSTTVVGLAIAIPCLVAHSYFVRKVETIASEMESIVSLLLTKCYQHTALQRSAQEAAE